MKFEMHLLEKYLIFSVIISVFIACSGYSFAYFVAKGGSVTGSGSKVEAHVAILPVVKFDGGNSVALLEDAVPGDYVEKDFTVSFTPTEKVKKVQYTISFNDIVNTFETCNESNRDVSVSKFDSKYNDCKMKNEDGSEVEELRYTLSRTKSGTDVLEVLRVGNLTNGVDSIDPITVEHEATDVATVYNYHFRVDFINTNQDQNHNVKKEFSVNIDVNF